MIKLDILLFNIIMEQYLALFLLSTPFYFSLTFFRSKLITVIPRSVTFQGQGSKGGSFFSLNF